METSLFTGAIPNPVRNSQTSRFVSFRCQVKIREGQAGETAWCYGCSHWWWRTWGGAVCGTLELNE